MTLVCPPALSLSLPPPPASLCVVQAQARHYTLFDRFARAQISAEGLRVTDLPPDGEPFRCLYEDSFCHTVDRETGKMLRVYSPREGSALPQPGEGEPTAVKSDQWFE